MKRIVNILAVLLIAISGYKCNNLSTDPLQTQTVQATSPTCFNCHGENTADSVKVKWAQAGYQESVHMNGIQAPILASYWDGVSKNIWYIAGYEWHGSDAFYSNGSGCQVCHTGEGFLKEINGDYGTINWNTGSAFLTAINADTILNPSPINCFTCHAPHANQNFDLTVAPGTPVTIETGGVYNKAKGNLCANCHHVRLSGKASVNDYIATQVTAGISKSSLTRFGPHHGPQSDVNLGKGGAEYLFTYTNHAGHSTNTNANCVNCHMADDFANLSEPARYALSPAVGGHSMAVVGIVHGNPTANTAGCTFTGCHDPASGYSVKAATFTGAGADYLSKGKAYVDKTLGGGTDSSVFYGYVNGLLKLLANPATSCTGFLTGAYTKLTTTGTITWSTMPDATYADTTSISLNPCVPTGFSANLPAAAATASTVSTVPSGQMAMAIWNFQLFREDKSFGIHNPTYVLEILYDTCLNLDIYINTATTGVCEAAAGGARP